MMVADFRRHDPYAPRPQSAVPYSILNTREGAVALTCALLHKLGGKLELSQADFDVVAFNRLMESNDRDEHGKQLAPGTFAIWLEKPYTGVMQ